MVNRIAVLPVILVGLAIVLGACAKDGSDTVAPVSNDPQVQAGYQLVSDRSCNSCHSVDGSSRSGPSWEGLAGSTVTLTDGQSVVVDDAYLRLSLTDPDTQVRRGYRPGVMSAYMRNQPTLTADEVTQIVAYLDTLK